jgi:hypothetical protein
MYQNEIKSQVNTSGCWVIVCSIVGTHFSIGNQNHFSWNKEIRNISLDVDLIEMIILKFGLECFVIFTETLFCAR